MDKERMVYYIGKGIEFSLILLIFILPFSHTASIRAFCIILATVLWIGKMIIERQLLFKRTPLDLPILAFILWGIISLTTATDLKYSLEEIKGEMLTYFLLFYLTVNNIKEEKQVKRLIKSLSLGLLVMASYGIYQFIILDGNIISSSVRISSFTSDYNYLATYLIIAIPIVFLQSFFARGWAKGLAYLSTFLAIFAIYLTNSRASWLALFIQIILYGLLTKDKKVLIGIGFIAIIIAIIIAISPAKEILIHRVPIITSTGEIIERDTALSRLVIWKEGIEKIKGHPITGIGYGRESFKKAFPDVPVMKEDKGLWHTHNVFIETALQIGIPGMLFLILQLLLLINIFWKGFRRERQGLPKFFFLGLLLIIFGFFARNQFDHVYVDSPTLMFWLLMGMGMALMRERRHG
jgi:O-antigen ligase